VSAPSPPTTAPRPGLFSALRRESGASLTTLLLFVFLGVTLLLPIASVMKSGFVTRGGEFSFEYLAIVLADPVLGGGIVKAAGIAVATTCLATLIALPLAVLTTRFEFRGRAVCAGLVLLPLILPPFVGAIGLRQVLGRFGPLTLLFDGDSATGVDWLGSLRVFGVIVVEALSLYPVVLLNLSAALANIDPTLERASRNLGASPLRTFFEITLPLARPGLFAGATLVLIWSFTELGTPLTFQVYDVAPVQVFQLLSEMENPIPHALVLVMLFASTLLYLVGRVLLGRSTVAHGAKAAVSRAPTQLSGVRALLALAPFVLVLSVSLLPHLSVILTSLSTPGSWYKTFVPSSFTLSHFASALNDELVMPSSFGGHVSLGAVGNSMLYAGAATLIGVVASVAAALVIVRSRLKLRFALDALTMLPLAVPGLVLAFGYLSVSVSIKRELGPLTPAFLDAQRFPVVLLVLAYAARRLPYIVRSAVAGLEQTPPILERAAQNLGASRLRALRSITLPLIFASVLAGALMAFSFALLEVSDSLILAQTAEYFPITKAIWELSQRLGDGVHVASALGVWAMTLLFFTLLTAGALMGKKIGGLFRL
jgi:iron(III) transport system permease protein